MYIICEGKWGDVVASGRLNTKNCNRNIGHTVTNNGTTNIQRKELQLSGLDDINLRNKLKIGQSLNNPTTETKLYRKH